MRDLNYSTNNNYAFTLTIIMRAPNYALIKNIRALAVIFKFIVTCCFIGIVYVIVIFYCWTIKQDQLPLGYFIL